MFIIHLNLWQSPVYRLFTIFDNGEHPIIFISQMEIINQKVDVVGNGELLIIFTLFNGGKYEYTNRKV